MSGVAIGGDLRDDQDGEGVVLAEVIAELHIPRIGWAGCAPGPMAWSLTGAYVTGVIDAELRRRGIEAVIPE